MLDAESYTSYEFEMFEGEQLDASISTGQGQLDVYLLDSENFYRYQNLGSFEYDQFYENILSANVKFIAPHDGFWYVVLLNEESYAVTVDVNYDVY